MEGRGRVTFLGNTAGKAGKNKREGSIWYKMKNTMHPLIKKKYILCLIIFHLHVKI